jgi:hypothetical protein
LAEPEPVRCPFCGAPYRDVIPADVVQLKCKYCGGIFQVALAAGEVARCVNHPEKVAVGMCNDCGREFCGNCLHAYRMAAHGENATLYLCPNCLSARYQRKTQGFVYTGALFAFLGLLLVFVVPVAGAVFLVPGGLSLAYGLLAHAGEAQESNVDELKNQQEQKKAELVEQDGVDYDAVYDDLVARYVDHWGPSLGTQLLDDEINACMRHGQSFPEAVIAVYRRQKAAKQTSS